MSPHISLLAWRHQRHHGLYLSQYTYHAFVPHNCGSKVTLAPRFTIEPAPPLRELELVARVRSTHPIPEK